MALFDKCQIKVYGTDELAIQTKIFGIEKEHIGERITSVTSEEMEKVSHGIQTMLAID